MTNPQEQYKLYREFMDTEEYQWPDGRPVSTEDQALYFMSLMWQVQVNNGNADWFPVDEALEQDEAVRQSVVGKSAEYRASVERMARDVPKVGVLAGETLKPRFWPTIIADLPNPSGILWGYSEKRQNYCGASYVPGEPKKFLKKGRRAGVFQVLAASTQRLVFEEMKEHWSNEARS